MSEVPLYPYHSSSKAIEAIAPPPTSVLTSTSKRDGLQGYLAHKRPPALLRPP